MHKMKVNKVVAKLTQKRVTLAKASSDNYTYTVKMYIPSFIRSKMYG
jgi:predicted transcriptional regulator